MKFQLRLGVMVLFSIRLSVHGFASHFKDSLLGLMSLEERPAKS